MPSHDLAVARARKAGERWQNVTGPTTSTSASTSPPTPSPRRGCRPAAHQPRRSPATRARRVLPACSGGCGRPARPRPRRWWCSRRPATTGSAPRSRCTRRLSGQRRQPAAGAPLRQGPAAAGQDRRARRAGSGTAGARPAPGALVPAAGGLPRGAAAPGGPRRAPGHAPAGPQPAPCLAAMAGRGRGGAPAPRRADRRLSTGGSPRWRPRSPRRSRGACGRSRWRA